MNTGSQMISEALPDPVRVVVVGASGVLRAEIASALDDDFVVVEAADARSAEEAASRPVHAAVIVADDLHDCTLDNVIQRVQVRSPGLHRVAVVVLAAHGDFADLPSAYHVGADDVARWPLEPDMFRARVRTVVRVAQLEATMAAAAECGHASVEDLRAAVRLAIHLINNAVAGVSGRAQLAALWGVQDEAGLIPVCLSEARKMSLVLGALHRLSESVPMAEEEETIGELALAGIEL